MVPGGEDVAVVQGEPIGPVLHQSGGRVVGLVRRPHAPALFKRPVDFVQAVLRPDGGRQRGRPVRVRGVRHHRPGAIVKDERVCRGGVDRPPRDAVKRRLPVCLVEVYGRVHLGHRVFLRGVCARRAEPIFAVVVQGAPRAGAKLRAVPDFCEPVGPQSRTFVRRFQVLQALTAQHRGHRKCIPHVLGYDGAGHQRGPLQVAYQLLRRVH